MRETFFIDYKRYESFVTRIHDSVMLCSKLSHEVALFANAYVAYCIESERVREIPFLSCGNLHQFYLNCLHLFTGTAIGHKAMSNFFSNAYLPSCLPLKGTITEFKLKVRGLSSIKATLARKMATNASNAFLFASQNRTKSILHCELYQEYGEFSGKRRKLIVDNVVLSLFADGSKTYSDDASPPLHR